jgi:hypothetical protein
VIAATGYRSALPELLGLPGSDTPDALPAGLHVIGFRESARGALFEIRRDSIGLARAIARELAPLPPLGDSPDSTSRQDQAISREKISVIPT